MDFPSIPGLARDLADCASQSQIRMTLVPYRYLTSELDFVCLSNIYNKLLTQLFILLHLFMLLEGFWLCNLARDACTFPLLGRVVT